MPRKQARQNSRKRLWFNVVEFDKETGRPLWRNKKSKLENTLPPCVTDPKFTALLEKLRKETVENIRNSESTSWSTPYSPAWSLQKYNLNSRCNSEISKTSSSVFQSNNFQNPCYEEESSPKLVMQFQHFSPLAESTDVSVEQQTRQIQDLLKMKSGQDPFSQSYHEEQTHTERGNFMRRDVTGPCGMISSCVTPGEWRMDNTVRLHHLDLENTPNYSLARKQQVPLTIY